MTASETSNVRLVDPQSIRRNPDNPRLIFREDELKSLEDSIFEQGILVPLTVYAEGSHFVILDGERRWRCASKLAMATVPVIVQPKPDKVANIMMMFAIHKTRNDWDPLPTAMKLADLQKAMTQRLGRAPKERELASAASLSPNEVRRYRNIMGLPERYKAILLAELNKPRTAQTVTVDHILEATRGAKALVKVKVISSSEAEELVDVIVKKFQDRILNSTVEPRLLTRIARAIGRGEISVKSVRAAILKIITSPKYTVDDAFKATAVDIDFSHATTTLIDRVVSRLDEQLEEKMEVTDTLRESLENLLARINSLLSS